jgi:GTP-binding protein YchF
MTSVGLIGLPGGGKSTVFQALTGHAVAPQFLGYDLKPHQAVVKIPDPRLDYLSDFYKTKSTVHAVLEFLDLPGFEPATAEAKLKNAVLGHYAKADTLALVVNCWEEFVQDEADRGIRRMLEELILLDAARIESTANTLEKQAKLKASSEIVDKFNLLTRLRGELENGVAVRQLGLSEPELKLLRDVAPMSLKPVIAVLNVADDAAALPDDQIPGLRAAQAECAAAGVEALRMPARLEAELAGLEPADAAEFMAEFGVTEPGLPRFIRAAFSTLGLITFLTASEKECRSWNLRGGSTAQQAAGTIHSDLARGFIRAETVAYQDFVEHGGETGAKAAGKYRLEGKDYGVQDGDILHIRFNV